MRFGKRTQEPVLNLVCRVSDKKNSRFSFIVSTKIDKRATHRNRIRRLLSEAVRLHIDEIKSGLDCVFIAKKGLEGVRQKEVEQIVMGMLTKAARTL